MRMLLKIIMPAALFGAVLFAGGCSSSREAETLKLSTAVPAGVVASNYTAHLTATGGSEPYTWAVISAPDSFPTGLTLDPAGSITGAPTTKGTYNFTVEAADAQGHKASAPVRLYVYTGTNPNGLL